MSAHLGPEIAKARSLKSSPFYVRGDVHGEPPVRDMTEGNYFFRGTWDQMLPHFKYVLSLKGLDYRFKIVTDERLKSVFVGDTSYKARHKKQNDNEEPINGLADLVSGPHLLIIRLGFLGYKNVAMPGLLKESLMLREVARKPTWLVENPECVFEHGNHSFSDEVWSYITRNFDTSLDLTSTSPTVAEMVETADTAPIPTERVARPARAVAVEPLDERGPEPAMAVDDGALMDSISEALTPKPKKGGGKFLSKRGGGGRY